jgi:hypothetical protein
VVGQRDEARKRSEELEAKWKSAANMERTHFMVRVSLEREDLAEAGLAHVVTDDAETAFIKACERACEKWEIE